VRDVGGNLLTKTEWDGTPLDESKVKIVAFHGQPRPGQIESGG
jgi:hypothetical protein